MSYYKLRKIRTDGDKLFLTVADSNTRPFTWAEYEYDEDGSSLGDKMEALFLSILNGNFQPEGHIAIKKYVDSVSELISIHCKNTSYATDSMYGVKGEGRIRSLAARYLKEEYFASKRLSNGKPDREEFISNLEAEDAENEKRYAAAKKDLKERGIIPIWSAARSVFAGYDMLVGAEDEQLYLARVENYDLGRLNDHDGSAIRISYNENCVSNNAVFNFLRECMAYRPETVRIFKEAIDWSAMKSRGLLVSEGDFPAEELGFGRVPEKYISAEEYTRRHLMPSASKTELALALNAVDFVENLGGDDEQVRDNLWSLLSGSGITKNVIGKFSLRDGKLIVCVKADGQASADVDASSETTEAGTLTETEPIYSDEELMSCIKEALYNNGVFNNYYNLDRTDNTRTYPFVYKSGSSLKLFFHYRENEIELTLRNRTTEKEVLENRYVGGTVGYVRFRFKDREGCALYQLKTDRHISLFPSRDDLSDFNKNELLDIETWLTAEGVGQVVLDAEVQNN